MKTVTVDEILDIEVKLLMEAIFLRYHYDFRDYAIGSLRRRLANVMEHLGCATVSELQARVLREPRLFARLRDELTVQVSEMFRDPAYFKAIRADVVPVLRTYPSIKIWVAGCSTGEEVYSLAILLQEEGLLARTLIYATDINVGGLEAAKCGVYDLDRIAQFSLNYQQAGGKHSLSDYYIAAYGSARFDRELIKRVVFSDHDLATDSVFAEVQLVSCRNVLIYFDRPLQDRTFGLFCDALCHGGFLGLGMHETPHFSTYSSCFTSVASGEKIFRKAAC